MNQIQDQIFLKETLKLAKKGLGWTNPNPMVGAILVKNGKIIGKGYHKRAGSAHAEIEAMSKDFLRTKFSKGSAEGITLYINLEPCSHFGRTPPCVDAIIEAKIGRVVCSTLDPNPKVRGQGVAKLREAGIDLSVGILEDQARQLNEAFFTFHGKNRPFVALKFAASLDGKIATKIGDSKWITNEKSREFARSLRSHYQSILVGINTVLKDNPHLGVRIKGKKDPLRIILDPSLKIPLESLVLRDNNVLIITTSKHDKQKLARLMQKGVQVLILSGNQISIPELLLKLKTREIISILVEGGSRTLGSFLDSMLIDKVYAFFSPILIGGEQAISIAGGAGINRISQAMLLELVSYQKFGDNYLITGYTKQKQNPHKLG